MKRIAILGSTGSIGTQTLDVIARHRDRFRVEALAAGTNVALAIEQARAFEPKLVSLADEKLAREARAALPAGVRVVHGEEGLLAVAADNEADVVVTAVVGSRGLKPTLAAIGAGKTIGLANKETLVAAGRIVNELADARGVAVVPIDSEHSAIFQCLNGEPRSGIDNLVITASGGSFRDRTRDQLAGVTVEEALRHPNWSMGAKVTIDSATMANKGLEVIEAHWLFRVPFERIRVLIHPESIVHSMVEFVDGSIVAQLGVPDMRVPIQYALTHPERLANAAKRLDLAAVGKLHFREADFERYPCLRMAYESGRAGGTAPAVFNAANEAAVARFLKGDLAFLQIEDVVASVLERHVPVKDADLDEILRWDAWARQEAESAFR